MQIAFRPAVSNCRVSKFQPELHQHRRASDDTAYHLRPSTADEGATLFTDMVTQTSLGHQFITYSLGEAALPNTTWQIDPFGHSVTQATLLGPQAGMPSLFVGRVDWQDKALRLNESALEMLWYGSESQPDIASFTDITFNGYWMPDGFCWDLGCTDDPIIDDASSPMFNVPQRLADFLAAIQPQAACTLGNHIMVTMGADFNYQQADSFFSNMDRLIQHWNAAPNRTINLLYSTPAAYAAAKLQQAANNEIQLPIKQSDDFFPYDFFTNGYLTGYYTSRPALKGYIRDSSALLHAAEQLVPFGFNSSSGSLMHTLQVEGTLAEPAEPLTGADGNSNPVQDALFPLLDSLSIAQHHDAVTGTSRLHVACDYERRLHIGRTSASASAGSVLASMANISGVLLDPLDICPLSNVTICPPLQSGAASIAVVVYNSRSQTVNTVVRVPVQLQNANASFRVITDSASTESVAQILPLSAEDAYLREINGGTPADNIVWLAWPMTVPAMGLRTVVLQSVADAGDAPNTFVSTLGQTTCVGAAGAEDTVLSNGQGLAITLSADTALLSGLSVNASGRPLHQLNVTQDWSYYVPAVGTDGNFAKSGAYIFRPNISQTFAVNAYVPAAPTTASSSVQSAAAAIQSLAVRPLHVDADADSANPICITPVLGPVVQEARQNITSWLSQTTRMAVGQLPEFEWTVGPLPLESGPQPTVAGPAAADVWGREVVMRLNSSIASNRTWYTDSNGRDLMQRVRNHRKYWNLTVEEPASGNYYPVPTSISMRGGSGSGSLFVNTDRSQGGSSLEDGSVELMVHRRLSHDDQLGVGEALNDSSIIRGSHRFYADSDSDAAAQLLREDARSSFWRPQIFAAPISSFIDPASGSDAGLKGLVWSYSLLNGDLPANLELMTVRWTNATSMLLRIAHMYGVGEHSTLSQNATVDISSLLAGVSITSCTETLVTGFGNPSQSKLPAGVTNDAASSGHVHAPHTAANGGRLQAADLVVTLGPMQVRTFICAATRTR